MKPVTKTLVYGGVATAVLGPALVAGLVVSVAGGAGTFAGITVEDGLPALTDGFQNYQGGQTGGLFGEPAPGNVSPLVPGAPGNAG